MSSPTRSIEIISAPDAAVLIQFHGTLLSIGEEISSSFPCNLVETLRSGGAETQKLGLNRGRGFKRFKDDKIGTPNS